MSTSTCTLYQISAPDGSVLEGISELDPDCREHGLPEPVKGGNYAYDQDYWPAGHPLRRYAGDVREVRPDIVYGDYRVKRADRWRLERPREVEARLLREAEVGRPIPALRRLPAGGFRACPMRFGQR